MRALLDTAKAGMSQGALAVDQDTLSSLGAFDRRVNGAGTITAASAIFLASRYAANPLTGLTFAALAEGSDTDTIAACTGALLGSLSGVDWLGSQFDALQDRTYISSLARRLLVLGSPPAGGDSPLEWDRFRTLRRGAIPNDPVVGTILRLPDLREATVRARSDLKSRVPTQAVSSLSIDTNDGQRIYVKRSKRITGSDRTAAAIRDFRPVNTLRFASVLAVANLTKSIEFYCRALGMTVTDRTNRKATLNHSLVLSEEHKAKAGPYPEPCLYVEVNDLAAAFGNVKLLGGRIAQDVHPSPKHFQFRCSDPDGYVIQVFESRGDLRSRAEALKAGPGGQPALVPLQSD
jgi:catechol 2,3-dioxygenase-like lactoylglutathione lyase family enzyme